MKETLLIEPERSCNICKVNLKRSDHMLLEHYLAVRYGDIIVFLYHEDMQSVVDLLFNNSQREKLLKRFLEYLYKLHLLLILPHQLTKKVSITYSIYSFSPLSNLRMQLSRLSYISILKKN